MPKQNPLSEGALTIDDVREGVRFRWYTPERPETVKVGVFTSGVYFDGREDQLVNCRLDGQDSDATIELCSMGITVSSDGIWTNCLTVED